MNNKQKLPEWFQGVLYKHGEEVTNPFSGESIELTPEELSIYDFIIGAQMILEMKLNASKRVDIIKDMSRGISWFQHVNSKAYMVLLD